MSHTRTVLQKETSKYCVHKYKSSIEFQQGKHLDSKIKRGDFIRLKGLFNKNTCIGTRRKRKWEKWQRTQIDIKAI